ncbi:MAG: PilZ domain-containing protein [Syntrophaceae bacterium]|nr:PilZ domain-containing protein [Syntrophaceae bacterium]
MNQPPTDIILGRRAFELLQYIIDSRGRCRISLPDTALGSAALLLRMEKQGNMDLLLIQGNSDWEEALASSGKSELLLEYNDENGGRCHFMVEVVRTFGERVWGKTPPVIYRVQRRMFFRLKAQPGTEVGFKIDPRQEARGIVRDYSLGGLAFWPESPLPLKTEDLVEDLRLRIPAGGSFTEIAIYAAVVRRVEPGTDPEKPLYALEFLGMSRRTRRQFAAHILGEKRRLLRQFKIPPFLLEGPRAQPGPIGCLPTGTTQDRSSPRAKSRKAARRGEGGLKYIF